jgi:hypothetical protein
MEYGPGTIEGTVRDGEGHPVPEAVLGYGGYAEATCDAQGRFRLIGLWLGRDRLAVGAPGFYR